MNIQKLTITATFGLSILLLDPVPALASGSESSGDTVTCSDKQIEQSIGGSIEQNIYKRTCYQGDNEVCSTKYISQKVGSIEQEISKEDACDSESDGKSTDGDVSCRVKSIEQILPGILQNIFKKDCSVEKTVAQNTDKDEPTPTPTPKKNAEESKATPTPEVLSEVDQLPSTGPGAAVLVALTGISSALIGRKHFTVK